MKIKIYAELEKRKRVRESRQGSHMFGDGGPVDDFGKDVFDRCLLHSLCKQQP